MNPITGEQVVEIGGRRELMRFTWKALSQIEARFGEAPNMMDPEVVAGIAAAGIEGITAEEILEASPPLALFAAKVQEALTWAYFGAEGLPKESGEGAKKKRTNRDRRMAGAWRRIRRLFGRE